MIYCSHSQNLIHPQVGGRGLGHGEKEDRGDGNAFFGAMVIFAVHGGPASPGVYIGWWMWKGCWGARVEGELCGEVSGGFPMDTAVPEWEFSLKTKICLCLSWHEAIHLSICSAGARPLCYTLPPCQDLAGGRAQGTPGRCLRVFLHCLDKQRGPQQLPNEAVSPWVIPSWVTKAGCCTGVAGSVRADSL